MRDLVVTAIILGSLPFVFKRPWFGVLLWTWIGMMAPHRLTWGFAFNAPFAAIVGAVTLIALLVSKEPKQFPVTPVTVTLILLVLWMNVTYPFRINPTDYPFGQWDKVMKIQLFIAVTLLVMNSAQRIRWLVWVATLSIAFYGVKGGIYTLMTGGGGMVLGPEGGFIGSNNHIATALTVVLPLMRFLQLDSTKRWIRWSLGASMALCAVSILGSYSRGGLLAIAAMGAFLWLKSRNRIGISLAMLLLIPLLLNFMPEKWFGRMDTIATYEQDGSAMGRINAWNFAVNLAKDRPLVGGGFGAFTPEAFTVWAPNPNDFHDSHSIWFTMLGEHGFVGLGLFVLLWLLAWRLSGGLIRSCKGRSDLLWVADLARMIQVAFIGYWVGGSFLGLAYWDMPYLLASVLVLCRVLVDRHLAVPLPTGAPTPVGSGLFHERKKA